MGSKISSLAGQTKEEKPHLWEAKSATSLEALLSIAVCSEFRNTNDDSHKESHLNVPCSMCAGKAAFVAAVAAVAAAFSVVTDGVCSNSPELPSFCFLFC